MLFRKAFELMKQGMKVKLPSWAGYWYWSKEKQTIIMHTKDGIDMDIRETQIPDYTFSNIASDEWTLADSKNCPELGGEATFSFGEAIKSAEEKIGEPVEVIDSFFQEAPVDAKPLWFLGKSLELLAGADIAYFAKGWQEARGCKIENTCAIEYGIPVIEDYTAE